MSVYDLQVMLARTGAGNMTSSSYEFRQVVKNRAAGLLAFALMPLLILQRVLNAILVPLDLVLRLAGRQQWRVEARKLTPPSHPHSWALTGWKASGLLRDKVRLALEHGLKLPG